MSTPGLLPAGAVLLAAYAGCTIDIQLGLTPASEALDGSGDTPTTAGATDTGSSGGMPAEEGCPDPGFADLEPGDEAHEYARRLVCAGVVDAPTPEQPNFEPSLGHTRAEYLRFQLELGFPDLEFAAVDAPLDYIDVSPDAWYAPYVAFATAQGIVEGYSGGLFRPDVAVNRAEASEIAVNVAGAPDFAASERYTQLRADYLGLIAQGAMPEEFADVTWDALECAKDPGFDDSCWFYHSVYALHGFDGAMCGQAGNQFVPAAAVSRSEAARITCIVAGLCPAEECP